MSFGTKNTLPWWLSWGQCLRLSCLQVEIPYHVGSTPLCQQVGLSELDEPGQGCGTPSWRNATSYPDPVTRSFSFHHQHWLEQSLSSGPLEVLRPGTALQRWDWWGQCPALVPGVFGASVNAVLVGSGRHRPVHSRAQVGRAGWCLGCSASKITRNQTGVWDMAFHCRVPSPQEQ